MDFNTLQTVLIAIAPAFASITTIIGCLVNISVKIKGLKKESDDKLLKAETKLQKAYNDIATIKAKCESMEKQMKEKK